MPSFRPLPQELVDKIIDELGKDYQDHDHEKRPGDRLNVVGEALHSCALVSKNWTGRSRVHLFKEVTVKPDGVGSFFVPPVAIMPYVTKLGMVLLYDIYRLSPSPDLLTRLCACPIVFLRITEGALTTARVRLVEFIAAISPTLQTVSFEFCSLPLSLIHHIVLAHPDLKQLHLRSCKIKAPNSDRPTTPQLGTPHSPDLELGVFSSSYFRGQVSLITEIVQLPVKFSKLNFDYALTLGTTHFANALIEANAESLSSLTVHIYDSSYHVLGGNPPFSLGACFNLSELLLDMEDTPMCFLATSANILSTLNSTKHTRLKWIWLATNCLYKWTHESSRHHLSSEWRHLDTTLSELAQVTTGARGEKLICVLVTVCNGNCVPFGTKWVSTLLPRFHGVGELYVQHQRRLHGCVRDYEQNFLEDGEPSLG